MSGAEPPGSSTQDPKRFRKIAARVGVLRVTSLIGMPAAGQLNNVQILRRHRRLDGPGPAQSGFSNGTCR